MQTYEGYFESGRFFALGQTANIPERKRTIVTVLDEAVRDDALKNRLSKIDEIFEMLSSDGEEVPEFKRVNFSREVDV